jgi:hypothetical protein
MTEVHHPLSAETQAMLTALQAAVRKALERKQRLGQYAIVWQDGRPARLDLNPTELDGLRSELTFLRRAMAALSPEARLTRMSDEARIVAVERRIRELGGE